jgi:hypothetical protein
MWYASILNLWLKYRLKTVDLARLKRTCTVNDGRVRSDPSRKGRGSPLEWMRWLAHTASASPPWTQRPEGGQEIETLTLTTRARRGRQLRSAARARL